MAQNETGRIAIIMIGALMGIYIVGQIFSCSGPETYNSGYTDSLNAIHELKTQRFSDSIDSTIAAQMKFKHDFDSIAESQKVK